MLFSFEGPPWRGTEPQFQTVPAGFGLSGSVLQRSAALSHTFLGLPTAVLSAAVPAAAVSPESGPVLTRQWPVLSERSSPVPAAPVGLPAEAGHGHGERSFTAAASSLFTAALGSGPPAGLLHHAPTGRAAPLHASRARGGDGRWSVPSWPGARHGWCAGWLWFFIFFLAWKITSFVGTNRFEFLFRGQNDLTSLYLNELISFFYLVFYIMSVALYDIILYYILGGVFWPVDIFCDTLQTFLLYPVAYE